MAKGSGTKDDPWKLTTAPGSSSYTMHLAEDAEPPRLEALGRAELTHEPRSNKVRAI